MNDELHVIFLRWIHTQQRIAARTDKCDVFRLFQRPFARFFCYFVNFKASTLSLRFIELLFRNLFVPCEQSYWRVKSKWYLEFFLSSIFHEYEFFIKIIAITVADYMENMLFVDNQMATHCATPNSNILIINMHWVFNVKQGKHRNNRALFMTEIVANKKRVEIIQIRWWTLSPKNCERIIFLLEKSKREQVFHLIFHLFNFYRVRCYSVLKSLSHYSS